MIAPRVRRTSKKRHGIRRARVTHIHDGDAVAVHMADERMAAVDNDLHPIRPTTLVGTPKKPHIDGCRAGDQSVPRRVIVMS